MFHELLIAINKYFDFVIIVSGSYILTTTLPTLDAGKELKMPIKFCQF